MQSRTRFAQFVREDIVSVAAGKNARPDEGHVSVRFQHILAPAMGRNRGVADILKRRIGQNRSVRITPFGFWVFGQPTQGLVGERTYPFPPQRVEYVFAYPDDSDIVLAGPAEGWTVDDAGNVVGEKSAGAVLQLIDLIAALRTTDELLAGELISCSIDPTPAGLQRFARVMRGAGQTIQEGDYIAIDGTLG